MKENGWVWILDVREVDKGKIRFLMWDKVVEALIGATWLHVTPISSAMSALYGCT